MEHLTNMVTNVLESRGALNKIRAQLRANIFCAIHEQEGTQPPPNAALTSLQQGAAGQLAAQLVLDLLDSCQLDYSLSVLKPEADLDNVATDRAATAKSLGLPAGSADDRPLLVQLVASALSGEGMAPAGTGSAPAGKPAAGKPAAVKPATSTPSSPAVEAKEQKSPLRAAAPVAPPSPPRSAGRERPKSSPGSSSKPAPAASKPAAAASGTSKPATATATPKGAPKAGLAPLGKPKGGGGGFLSDLPPLGSGRPTVPPLGTAPSAATGEDDDERRLDRLENKLAGLAGMPLRPAAGGLGALAPLQPATGEKPTPATTTTPGGPLFPPGAAPVTAADFEMVEEEIIEEDFEDDEEDLSIGGSSAGTPTPGLGGLSPAGLNVAPSRSRQRLSPLETSTSMLSVDESMSPARLSGALQGYDLTESVEQPRRP